MSKRIATVESSVKRGLRERVDAVLRSLAEERRARALAIAVFVIGAGLMLLYRPFSQMEAGDSAGYDYIAQSILRGQLPYRDVVDIKTPGSMYVSAVAMAAGKLIGLRDVIAVRLFQALLVGLLSLVIFFTARVYLRNTIAALIASVFPVMSYKFAEWMVVGTQPKLPMILFGMLSLLLIAGDKPFWAGVCSMLAFLCWQPGLMFTGVAVLIFSKYFSSWRDLRALKVMAGAALPLAIVLVYFYSRGALGDLWAWTIAFNYSVFRPETQRAPAQALNHLWNVTNRIYGADIVLVLVAIAGFFMFAVERVRARLKGREGELFRHSVLIPPAVYFAFCIVNMQAGPDLIPFIPFIGMFAAWFLVQLGRFVSQRASGVRWDLLIPVGAALLMALVAVGRGLSYRIPPGFTLQDQDARFKTISDLLGPDDKIYVHGSVELLVLLNRPNLNAYTFLNQGIDRFASARRSVDFTAILDEMEAGRPKLVALSRLRTVASRELIERWVQEHYDKLESLADGGVYLRREP